MKMECVEAFQWGEHRGGISLSSRTFLTEFSLHWVVSASCNGHKRKQSVREARKIHIPCTRSISLYHSSFLKKGRWAKPYGWSWQSIGEMLAMGLLCDCHRVVIHLMVCGGEHSCHEDLRSSLPTTVIVSKTHKNKSPDVFVIEAEGNFVLTL